jgi:crotonobetainyl-CoA:carnitine CoA-transferase CaiB-like acyl-CoA transferase
VSAPDASRPDGAPAPMPLTGLKVLDLATLFAGPMIATLMADFGADVIKIEHPRGDAIRSFGWQKNGVSLWWALMSRNKRAITLNLSTARGQALLRELAADADVLIENFRPGTLERWGLGYDVLSAENPRLILVRTTGFGQTGPYRDRPGFGTLAEAMSGFAHMTGQPDGPPTLPPLALADSVCALFGTFATMFALYHRDAHRADRGGPGQVIDLSIYEPFFWILGPQALAYDQLGIVQGRTGNRAPFNAPRNIYQAKDGRWLGLSASAQSIAERVMRLVGRPDLIDQPWFRDHAGRLAHQDELDALIGGWIGERDSAEVVRTFEEFEAAIAPIYSIADIFLDPQYQARETIATVDDPRLGPVRIQNVVPRLTRTPGQLRHLGPDLGAHNREIYQDLLGYPESDLAAWQREGII